jgi:hypothetical protein
MDDILVPKSSTNYYCMKCDYNTSRYSQFERHLNTLKHNKNDVGLQNISKLVPKQVKVKYVCECGNEYKYRQGLWKHKQSCIQDNSKIINKNNNYNNSQIENNNTNIITQLIEQNLSLITQNQEFKELILEQNKQILEQNKQLIEVSKDKSITNNTNCNNIINHFNLHLFLNEKCKNALNITEFVEQLPVSLDDLEETGRLGYAEGISRIFVKGLKNLDIYQRPIHCSDAKRETLYIKNENNWHKDDEQKSQLTNIIKQVANKNIKNISQWQQLHPNYNNSQTKENDKYLKIICGSMCGSSSEETQHNYNKIVKNIIKETIINKNEMK